MVSKKREIEISVRVNEQEHQALLDRKQGSTMAGWLRDLALKSVPVKPADPHLIRQLGRIGSNLNQLSKHANTHKELDNHVLEEIAAIRKLLHAAIKNNVDG